MFVKQISVFVENKFGRLHEILELLAGNDIDISALSIADTTDFGILRLIVNDPIKTEKILKEAGITVKLTDVIAVAIEDKPGGLSNVVGILKDNKISIEYIYAFVGKREGSALDIVRVDELEKAVSVLKAAGINVLDPNDVYGKY